VAERYVVLMDDQRVNIVTSIVKRNIFAIEISDIIKRNWPDKKGLVPD